MFEESERPVTGVERADVYLLDSDRLWSTPAVEDGRVQNAST